MLVGTSVSISGPISTKHFQEPTNFVYSQPRISFKSEESCQAVIEQMNEVDAKLFNMTAHADLKHPESLKSGIHVTVEAYRCGMNRVCRLQYVHNLTMCIPHRCPLLLNSLGKVSMKKTIAKQKCRHIHMAIPG